MLLRGEAICISLWRQQDRGIMFHVFLHSLLVQGEERDLEAVQPGHVVGQALDKRAKQPDLRIRDNECNCFITNTAQ